MHSHLLDLYFQRTVGGVRGTVGLATDLVQRRVDMGQKSTKERDTVTILTQSTEEEDAMDPQRRTPINHALSDHVPSVCTIFHFLSYFRTCPVGVYSLPPSLFHLSLSLILSLSFSAK